MFIQKISDDLQTKVLGYASGKRTALDKHKIERNLKPFGLDVAPDLNTVVNLPIPEGFKTVKEEVEEAINLYTLDTIKQISAASRWELPVLPTNFQYVTGWQVWQPKTSKWQRIDAPVNGKTFFLDIETVEVNGRWLPTCAVAMSAKGWLLWVTDFDNMTTTIPYGNNNVMINYNTPYDRSYLSSEYLMADSGNRFFDLMSAWIVCRGLSNQQRPMYLSEDITLDWMDQTATNSLSSVYEFYFGHPLDKGVRDQIVDIGLPWVRHNMQSVIRYCCEDVLHTAQLHARLYPEYNNHRPSDVSKSGSLILGSVWLPLDAERFPEYYNRAESMYQANISKTNDELFQLATEYLELSKTWDKMPKPAEALDWTEAVSGKNKGLPMWYRKVLSDYAKGDLTLSKRFVPIVLGLTWKGEELLWGISDGVNDKGEPTPGWYTETYGSLPHPEKRGQAVTTVFAKGFVKVFESGQLSTSNENVKELLANKMATIQWVSLRKRVKDIRTESPEGFPVVVPQILVTGTITGRCADNLWQVTPNPKKTRIGTELKSMIAPPKGYTFVGADVDSQEAWLAGIMGDSVLGMSASTPLGFICVAGTKAKTLEESTDIHSVMAKETGISRDNTKTRVYGAIYGQGKTGDMNGLLKNIPGITVEEAKANSELFIAKFKGQRKNYRNFDGGATYEYAGGLASDSFNVMEKIADSRVPRTPLLGNVLSDALRGIKDFKPSRVNWVIQSSGVDFRDMLVLLVKHFYNKLGVDGRILMTIHDELRTMVKIGDEMKAAYALQLAHLYVRSAFIDALSLDCIPAGVAWFSAVDIDGYCLRKDPEDPQVTPSQPEGLPKGYTVSPAQLLEYLSKQ